MFLVTTKEFRKNNVCFVFYGLTRHSSMAFKICLQQSAKEHLTRAHTPGTSGLCFVYLSLYNKTITVSFSYSLATGEKPTQTTGENMIFHTVVYNNCELILCLSDKHHRLI